MRAFAIHITLIFCIFFISCSKEESAVIEKKKQEGQKYFPLKAGSILTYEVTEIVIDKYSEYYDTVKYLLKEVTDIPFVDNEGDTAYRLERYRKYGEDSQWKIYQAWSAKLTDYTAEKVEDNRRVVKMRFPLELGKYWDGNLYNDLRKENSIKDSLYQITAVNHLYNGKYYNADSCITIMQYFNESLINKDLEYEIYAPYVGLVHKEVVHSIICYNRFYNWQYAHKKVIAEYE